MVRPRIVVCLDDEVAGERWPSPYSKVPCLATRPNPFPSTISSTPRAATCRARCSPTSRAASRTMRRCATTAPPSTSSGLSRARAGGCRSALRRRTALLRPRILDAPLRHRAHGRVRLDGACQRRHRAARSEPAAACNGSDDHERRLNHRAWRTCARLAHLDMVPRRYLPGDRTRRSGRWSGCESRAAGFKTLSSLTVDVAIRVRTARTTSASGFSAAAATDAAPRCGTGACAGWTFGTCSCRRSCAARHPAPPRTTGTRRAAHRAARAERDLAAARQALDWTGHVDARTLEGPPRACKGVHARRMTRAWRAIAASTGVHRFQPRRAPARRRITRFALPRAFVEQGGGGQRACDDGQRHPPRHRRAQGARARRGFRVRRPSVQLCRRPLVARAGVKRAYEILLSRE